MCLSSHLAAKLALMGAHETLTLTRPALEDLLRNHGPCVCVAIGESDVVRDEPPSELKTTAVAAMIGEPSSSVRRAIAAGVFGDAKSLKLNGKSYRVPREMATRVARALESGVTLAALTAQAMGHTPISASELNQGVEAAAPRPRQSGHDARTTPLDHAGRCERTGNPAGATTVPTSAGSTSPTDGRGGRTRLRDVPSLGAWRSVRKTPKR